MTHARHADKYIVKFFGRQFDEFRREMSATKEVIMSDPMSSQIPDAMLRHAENVNFGDKSSGPFRQAMVKKY